MRERATAQLSLRDYVTCSRAQYSNGGWPQINPLQGGYHDAMTLKDDARVDVAEWLADLAPRQGDFAFVPAALAADAEAAADRAAGALFPTQIVASGQGTGGGNSTTC